MFHQLLNIICGHLFIKLNLLQSLILNNSKTAQCRNLGHYESVPIPRKYHCLNFEN
jgi:hypothetical protein